MSEVSTDFYAYADPRELQVRSPFSDLFLIDPAMKLKIEASMKADGYDPSKPINVWRQENVVIDGHTRKAAATAVGLTEVPVYFHDFTSEDEAMRYAVANQRDRRNLTEAEIFRCIEAVDKRKRSGERTDLASSDARSPYPHNKSAYATASIVGVSPAKVERARSVIDHAETNPDIRNDVLEGKASINKAANIARKAKRDKKPPKYHDPVIPKPRPVVEEPRESSLVEATQDDLAWLESFPIRAKVVKHRFDADALLFRRIESELRNIKSAIMEVCGERSESGRCLLHRDLHWISRTPAVNLWRVCSKCNGSGMCEGSCKKCHGGGYEIPKI